MSGDYEEVIRYLISVDVRWLKPIAKLCCSTDAPAVGKSKGAPKGELKSFWDDPCSFSFCVLDKRGRTFAVAAITRKQVPFR